jgi:hypothetical protein
LAQWNNLSTNSALKTGQKLTIMVPVKVKKTKADVGSRRHKKAQQ